MAKGWEDRASESDKKAKNRRKNAAERYVFYKLKSDGQHPRWAKTGKGYDIYTRNRRIEVKGRDSFKLPVWLGFSNNFLKLGRDLDKFWIYLVLGVHAKHKRKIVIKISSEEILKNLSTSVQYKLANKCIRSIAKKQNLLGKH